MSDPLRDLMGELAGEPPAVADWAGRVRALVGRRRRRQRVLTVAAVAAVLAVGGAGVLLAAGQPTRDALVAAADPSRSPSPVDTASASAPAPEVGPTAPAAPAPSAEPEPEPEPTAEPAPSPASTSAGAPTPQPSYPPNGTQVIEITAAGRPDRPTVGQEWVLDVTARGSADKPYLQDACFDGGSCSRVATSCLPRERNYSPPPPRPATTQRTFRHTFTTPGRHEVLLEANDLCSYYQGYAKRVLVVDVAEAPPSASPAPSAPPSPDPSPEP